MTDTTAPPALEQLPEGFTWERTNMKAHLLIQPDPEGGVFRSAHSTAVHIWFVVDEGTLPDMKTYRSASYLFRPRRVKVSVSLIPDVTGVAVDVGTVEIHGFRVLKSGAMGEQAASWTGYSHRNEEIPVLVREAIRIQMATVPLPTVIDLNEA